jgi:uncharacterized membrane protein YhaH (DUF805 family)
MKCVDGRKSTMETSFKLFVTVESRSETKSLMLLTLEGEFVIKLINAMVHRCKCIERSQLVLPFQTLFLICFSFSLVSRRVRCTWKQSWAILIAILFIVVRPNSSQRSCVCIPTSLHVMCKASSMVLLIQMSTFLIEARHGVLPNKRWILSY